VLRAGNQKRERGWREARGAGKLEKELGDAARRARGGTRERESACAYESAVKATRGSKAGAGGEESVKKRSREERGRGGGEEESLTYHMLGRWEVKDGKEKKERKNDTAASKSFM